MKWFGIILCMVLASLAFAVDEVPADIEDVATPDEVIPYFFKEMSRSFNYMITDAIGSEEAKVKMRLETVQERIKEMVKLQSKGQEKYIAKVQEQIDKTNEEIDTISQEASEEQKQKIMERLEIHTETMTQLKSRINNTESKMQIENAIQISNEQKTVAQNTNNGSSSSNSAGVSSGKSR